MSSAFLRTKRAQRKTPALVVGAETCSSVMCDSCDGSTRPLLRVPHWFFFFYKNGVQCSIWSKRNVFSKMLNLPYCIVLICWLRVECWIGMTDQMLNVRLFYCSVLFYKWQITWYHEYALQWKTFYAKCINCWTFLSRKDWEEDMVWYFLLALKIFIWNTMLGSHMFWW